MLLRTLVAVERTAPRRLISRTLDALGAISARAESLTQLRRRLAVEPFDLVVLELGLSPDLNPGIIQELRELPEAPEVIILIDDDDDSEARAALLGAGAYSVLSPGVSDEAFQEALTTLAERRLEESRERLRSVPDEEYRLGDYVTQSPAMQAVQRSARRIAARASRRVREEARGGCPADRCDQPRSRRWSRTHGRETFGSSPTPSSVPSS